MPRRTPFIVPPTASESDYRRGRPRCRRARCPAAVSARLSGDHRARRRVFDGARSSGPMTAFNNLWRRAARDTQSKTCDVAQYRPAGCRLKPRAGQRRRVCLGITAVKRSRSPPLSRAVHIADAPIELLQGVFRCLRSTSASSSRIRASAMRPARSAARPLHSDASCVFLSLCHRPSRPASRGRPRRLLSRGSAA
jgi:hypothetical protein